MSNKQNKGVELPTALRNLRFVQDVIDGEYTDKPEQQKEQATFTEEINKKEWSMQQMIDNLVSKSSSNIISNKNSLIISSKTSQNKLLFGTNDSTKVDEHSRYIPTSENK